MTGFQLVGYYAEKPKVFEDNNSKMHTKIKVLTKPNFITNFGEDKMDLFEVYLWKGMSKEFIQAIPLNSPVSIKGRLELRNGAIVMIAEHIEKMDMIV